jgi:predicted amidohydrolase
MVAKPSKQVLGGREKVKVAIVQKSPAFMNRDASVTRACAAIEEAGRHGAQLVVFPEAWLAGYPYWTEGWDSPLPQWAGGRILFWDNALVVPSEDIHVAVFPGAFELHTGPQLEEPEQAGGFWGHVAVRAHALEAGAFVVSGCAVLHEADVSTTFPYKGRMNIGYANGGSEVVAPLGIALAGPVYGEALMYAEIEAGMIKATKAIVDTMGHYARPDVLRLLVHSEHGWQPAGSVRDLSPIRHALTDDALARAADSRDVDPATVVELAEEVRRAAG